MKIRTVLLAVAAVSCLASCTTTLHYDELYSREIEPAQGVLVTPVLADLEILSQKRIEPYKEVWNGNLMARSGLELEHIKAMTLSKAAEHYDADVLIAPTFSVEFRNNSYTVTVTGFPARYTNLRQATEADAWIGKMHEAIEGKGGSSVVAPKLHYFY